LTGCQAIHQKPPTEDVSLSPFAVAAANEEKAFTLSPADVDPSNPGYLKKYLAHFGLVPLQQTQGEVVERYRFLWCRAFHPAVLIEVSYDVSGAGDYIARVWDDAKGWNVEATHKVDLSHQKFYHRMIQTYDLLHLPWYDKRMGLDGSDWLIEISSGNTCHAIYRWTPEAGPVRTFGESLIEEGISSVLVPIY